MPYHSDRDDPSVDINMVRLLLEYGGSPNQRVHLNDGRTVWALFLLSMWETINYGEGPPGLTRAWYAACELLVQHGADFGCWLEPHPSTRQRSNEACPSAELEGLVVPRLPATTALST
ncbi:hypothetical protein F4820DRAFT_436943 [Hypoxylon rubiginosum]|uniref:Uncharacterized protein n=1 Tax=Hypoxylon rubiginosum TaxID=110542 RepID=A0ACB9YNN2_9PEZI|nr:hypothetical protein F4820DRAFT_436943 [Hypoxylon rubiginosum]